MMKFDPLLDFYDSTLTQAARNALIEKVHELSEQIWNSIPTGLVEITGPHFTKFSKAFQLHYVSGDLFKYADSLYSDDFVYINCTYSPLSLESEFEMYRFLVALNREGIFWHLYTPIFHPFLKDFYAKDFRVIESFRPNPYGVKHRFINVYNYPKTGK